MGPFFDNLSRWLSAQGRQVWKVNFNGGDRYFYGQPEVFDYVEGEDSWPAWIESLLGELGIEAIVLFGQSRPMHVAASRVARQLGIAVLVFEEGYQRPNYVTLEVEGVNGDSRVPASAEFYRSLPRLRRPATVPVSQPLWKQYWICCQYGSAALLQSWRFHRNRHHRSLNPISECYRWWILTWVRKFWRGWVERGMLEMLTAPERSKRWFLVPLQVRNDSQVWYHSRFGTVEVFIGEVIESFARYADGGDWLVLKHHPLDRAYSNYASSIRRHAVRHGVGDRVFYIHDQHLPTLLDHAKGVVTINSTAGMQALHHGVPVKVKGDAIYAVSGLVASCPLSEFWREPGEVDMDLYRRFRDYLVHATQLNGSFYGRVPVFEQAAEYCTFHGLDMRPKEWAMFVHSLHSQIFWEANVGRHESPSETTGAISRERFMGMARQLSCILLVGICLLGAVEAAETQRWSLGVAVGQALDSNLPEVIPNALKGDLEFGPAYLNGLLVRRDLGETDPIGAWIRGAGVPLATSIELFAAKAHGETSNVEVALDWRPALTLWSAGSWGVDLAWGLGVTHSFGKPWSDYYDPDRPEGYRTLFHMAPELALRYGAWTAGLRIHHGSGLYGIVAPRHVGWNYLTLTLVREL